jgi:VWFA-related protein
MKLNTRILSRIVTAVIAVAVCCADERPVDAQDGRIRQANVVDTSVPPGNLLGPWMRNPALSEDAIEKVASVWPSPDEVPRVLRELTEGLEDRLATVLVKVSSDGFGVMNGRGEYRSFEPELGRRTQPYATLTDAGFRIETRISGWIWTDDFSRQDDVLVRTTSLLRSERVLHPRVDQVIRSFATILELRTVYDPAGSEHPSAAPTVGTASSAAPASVIRILPPEREYRELLSGSVEVRTLVTHPAIRTVEFLLDGTPRQRKRRRPFKARVVLADPPREQTLEVRAFDAEGRFAATDRITLNRIDTPFGVRITALRGEEAKASPAVRVAAYVSVPRSATLQKVDFYRGENLVATLDDFGPGNGTGDADQVPVEALIEKVSASDFIRVTARLANGREREDAALIQGADYQDEIDVQLVQLQVLVVDERGNPVSGLRRDDFEIRENGARLAVEALHTATDVPLVLGFAIDSSESMLPIWRQLKYVAARFLDDTLTPRDMAFLVDFDRAVRLLQPLTGNKALLERWLDRVTPWGGTALNDGLLFSLLQYGSQPGRRALVMVTDGADLHSRQRPEDPADFARRLGLPIYFVEMDNPITQLTNGADGQPMTSRSGHPRAGRRIRRISQETGGRHFHIDPLAEDPPWTERIAQAFDQIEEDLRHQQVLTYYSSQPRGAAIRPEVRITRRGLKLRSAVPLEAIE